MKNNIEEIYCSYPICSSLHALGFTQENKIDGWYDDSGKLFSIHKKYFRPTVGVAIRWLKENYGFWIYCVPDCYGEEWFPKIQICSKEQWENIDMRSAVIMQERNLRRGVYCSEAEAIEAALIRMTSYLDPRKQSIK